MPAFDIQRLQPISKNYNYNNVINSTLAYNHQPRMLKNTETDTSEFAEHYLIQHKLHCQKQVSGSIAIAKTNGFLAGYICCAQEVSRYLPSIPELSKPTLTDNPGIRLITHLGHRLDEMEEKKTMPPSGHVSFSERYSLAPSSSSSIFSAESYTTPLPPSSMVLRSANQCSKNSSLGSANQYSKNNSLPGHPGNKMFEVVDTSVSMSMTETTTGSGPIWRPW